MVIESLRIPAGDLPAFLIGGMMSCDLDQEKPLRRGVNLFRINNTLNSDSFAIGETIASSAYCNSTVAPAAVNLALAPCPALEPASDLGNYYSCDAFGIDSSGSFLRFISCGLRKSPS